MEKNGIVVHSARLAAKKTKTYHPDEEEEPEDERREHSEMSLPAGWTITERKRKSDDRIDRVRDFFWSTLLFKKNSKIDF